MTELIILATVLALSIAGNVVLPIVLTKLHQDEKVELHNRLMARDFPEFKMSQDYDLELERKRAQIEKEGKEKKKEAKMTEQEARRRSIAANF